MALDELFKTFEFLKKRIEEHQEYLSQDETRTRQVLIDPLLKELGWDVGDPGVVELERRIVKGQAGGVLKKADYVLSHERAEVAVVEAKRLGRQLDDEVTTQASTYANINNIPWVVVTDGDQWRMHKVFQAGSIEDRTVMQFQVSEDHASKCALRSLALWRPNICDKGGPVDAAKPVLDDIERTTGPVRPTNQDDEPGDTEDSDWHPFGTVSHKGPKPTHIRFDDGGGLELPSWRRLYPMVVRHLCDIGRVSQAFRFEGRSRDTISTQRAYDSDPAYVEREEVGKSLWLELTRTPRDALNLSKRILDEFGIDLATVQVRYD